LRDAEALVAPQPLDLLVVDKPAFAAGIVVGAAMAPPGVGFGVVAQPLPQCGVQVDGCAVDWLMALSCSVLPGHSAGEPFTHPHRVDEVVHGRAPACRA